ncbi:DUF4876 domain-containing protein [Pseudoflavitalea rhizosphaerae]|uniref:DUF4876 domain-containing protein n=1 Tax=Pseudoflavitalea rhizosphaerae TaxID=1884793 RepID=UPI000F8F2967|nr:DUF4876 domain-containing protein [Pseudoflavitalea rhizosphaerae]
MRLVYNSPVVLLLFILLAAGCRKKDLQTNISPINVIVQASHADDYGFPLKDIKLTLKNTITGADLTQLSDKNGIAIFSEVSSGIYDVSGTITVDKTTFETVTGLITEQEEVHLNGSLTRLTLNPNNNKPVELKLEAGTIGQWVIKQIYYAGSNTKDGAGFRDQFIEIYNNSNDTLYADSLYFGQVGGSSANFATVDLNKPYFINDPSEALYKAWDWSKSIGINPADASAWKNYIYMKSLYRLPGHGTQYPVAPGKSIVIAQTALNHKSPYVGTDNKPIEIVNPALTVDLSNADFEVYLGGTIPNAFNSDIDNGNVPNAFVVEYSGRDLVLDNPGREAIVIFKTDKSLPEFGDAATPKGFGYYPDPTKQVIDASTTYFYQIPNNIIIDAVQLQHPSPTSSQRAPRKLVNSLDAGPTNVPDGAFSSQSLIRKTAKIVGGRRILMDTNNSANDFDFLEMATPKGFKD